MPRPFVAQGCLFNSAFIIHAYEWGLVMQIVQFEFFAQGATVDTEHLGRFALVATGILEYAA